MSQFLNEHNLPDSLFRALSFDGYDPGDKHSDISVTSAISPVRIRALKKRHKDKIQEDVINRIWSLFGQSVHSVIQRAEGKQSIAEERLYHNMEGWTISGQIDLYEDGILSDFKVTSVYSFLLGQKDEWVQQTNMGAFLLREIGFDIKGVQIVAILKDWSRRKAEFDPEYPQYAIIVKPMPLWPHEKVREFIRSRIKAHQEAENLPDDELPLCTPQERWERPEGWAVTGKGAKRATAVCRSEEEASQRLAKVQENNPKKKFEIQHRLGQNVRCQDFCPVARFCDFGREVLRDKIS